MDDETISKTWNISHERNRRRISPQRSKKNSEGIAGRRFDSDKKMNYYDRRLKYIEMV